MVDIRVAHQNTDYTIYISPKPQIIKTETLYAHIFSLHAHIFQPLWQFEGFLSITTTYKLIRVEMKIKIINFCPDQNTLIKPITPVIVSRSEAMQRYQAGSQFIGTSIIHTFIHIKPVRILPKVPFWEFLKFVAMVCFITRYCSKTAISTIQFICVLH